MICLSLSACAQENSKMLELIKKLPTIEYGQLPYWQGIIGKYNSFEHGFYNMDSISGDNYNNAIRQTLRKNKLSCFTTNIEQKVCECNGGDVFFVNENGCENSSSFKTKDSKSFTGIFCPSVFQSAKSILYEKYYVVYFWKAMFTEMVLYYTLIFDLEGNLLSQMTFDYWHTWFPYFPFHSVENKVRQLDYEKRLAVYLPNYLLCIKEPYALEGGGAYHIIRLNEDGHYHTCKEWKEDGQIEYGLTENDKYKNFIRINADGKKMMSLIVFVVQDADGYSNIREKADAGSKIIRTIKNNDIVFGTMTENGWCKIDFTADAQGNIKEGGYIHISRLHKISDSLNEFIELPTREEWKKNLKKK